MASGADASALGRTAFGPFAPSGTATAFADLRYAAGMTLVAAFLRLIQPAHMAVEHFDEGVYATNLPFADGGSGYPLRHFYAPPLLPGLIRISLGVERATCGGGLFADSLAAMAPSLIAGSLTVGLVAWVASCWFGRSAGRAAAWLAAFSDFHILYSRAALTDASLVLFVLAAVWFLERAMATRGRLAAALAGAATGLAWWTKYNGWLPLAIGLVGLGFAVAVDRETRRGAVHRFVVWMAVTLLAMAVWSPVWASIEFLGGGYAAVAANHRQYLVGFGGWLASLARQYDNHRQFESWPSTVGIVVAFMAVGMRGAASRGPNGGPHPAARAAIASGLAVIAAWLGAVAVVGILCVGFLARAIGRARLRVRRGAEFASSRDVDRADDAAETEPSMLAIGLLTAWVAGLFVATPFYHAYPRLTLPWLCGAWLGAARAMRDLDRWCGRVSIAGRLRAPLVTACVASSFAFTALAAFRLADTTVRAWEPRDGMRRIAAAVADRMAERSGGRMESCVVMVCGEPALAFHLNGASGPTVLAVGDLSIVDRMPRGAARRVFLVTGPNAERMDEVRRALAAPSDRIEWIADYAYAPSMLVQRNLAPRSDSDAAAERVRLFAIR